MNDIECESVSAAPLHLVPSREEPAHTFNDVLIDATACLAPRAVAKVVGVNRRANLTLDRRPISTPRARVVACDTESTVTRWVGVGHAQARASRELQGALAVAIVTIPALYMASDRDLVVSFPGTDQLLSNLKTLVPALQKIQMMPGCETLDAAGVVKRSQFCDHRLPAQPAELTSN